MGHWPSLSLSIVSSSSRAAAWIISLELGFHLAGAPCNYGAHTTVWVTIDRWTLSEQKPRCDRQFWQDWRSYSSPPISRAIANINSMAARSMTLPA